MITLVEPVCTFQIGRQPIQACTLPFSQGTFGPLSCCLEQPTYIDCNLTLPSPLHPKSQTVHLMSETRDNVHRICVKGSLFHTIKLNKFNYLPWNLIGPKCKSSYGILQLCKVSSVLVKEELRLQDIWTDRLIWFKCLYCTVDTNGASLCTYRVMQAVAVFTLICKHNLVGSLKYMSCKNYRTPRIP